MRSQQQATALVSNGPASSGEWKIENVSLRALKDDELLVRIVACGICLADVHFGDVAKEDAKDNPMIFYPRVLGHEGEPILASSREAKKKETKHACVSYWHSHVSLDVSASEHSQTLTLFIYRVRIC
jgi:D-arabinose 1-dehydrogenase-like Zn-dependent alcohol dehydrogenase